MKYSISFLLLFTISFCLSGFSQQSKNNRFHKVIIEALLTIDNYNSSSFADLQKDSIELEAVNYDYIDPHPKWVVHKEKVMDNKVKWVIYADRPLLIRSAVLGSGARFTSPGDSVFIIYNEKGRKYSGKSAATYRLQDELVEIPKTKFVKPTRHYIDINSCDEYFKWKQYLDNKQEFMISVIESNKEKITPLIYDLLKANVIENIEFSRGESFTTLWKLAKIEEYREQKKTFVFFRKKEEIGKKFYRDIDVERDLACSSGLTEILDSTLNNKWAKWLRSKSDFHGGDLYYYVKNASLEILNNFKFDITNNSINTKDKRMVLYYSFIKNNYKGLLRERILQYTLAEETIKKLGLNHPVTQSLLKDYYSLSGFPEYKQWMKIFEKKAAALYNLNSSEVNKTAPGFQLKDTKENNFTLKDIKGKIVLLDFWFTGCKGCVDMVPQLQKIEEEFKNDPNIVFLSVSTDQDKDRWIKSISQKKYTTGSGINLFTGGQGTNHAMLQDYNISSYPELYLINEQGEIVFPVPDPRKDSGVALISLLKKLRAQLEDGPYVLYKGDTVSVNTLKPSNCISTVWTKKYVPIRDQPIKVNVMTDEYPKTFSISLKKSMQNEPAVFAKPKKQLVISDIEGNFNALRKLLQSNGVIDKNYNWTFGEGHLVCVGDFFDRGEQVTEVLWLIYSLEEKAKAAGGYVHFILGNHEVLNLSGDQRYVRNKYKENAKVLNIDYKSLYDENTELGRWLRTKNIMEKIGDVLYCHAGVSRDVNNLAMSIETINAIIRPHYAERNEFKTNKEDPTLRVLFNSRISPFWYRGYFKDAAKYKPASRSQIDSSLQKFAVHHIITGHTIVGDTISVHFAGRIINVDTHHAEGKSEALLIEGEHYYRVNNKGKKELLEVGVPVEQLVH